MVNVQSIAAATTVDTGNENDTVNVGSRAPLGDGTVNSINAPLAIYGGLGSDQLNVDDSGHMDPNTGTLNGAAISGMGMSAGMTYDGVEDLNVSLGVAGDTFTVESTHLARDDAERERRG